MLVEEEQVFGECPGSSSIRRGRGKADMQPLRAESTNEKDVE
jgi:hypothetical protein